MRSKLLLAILISLFIQMSGCGYIKPAGQYDISEKKAHSFENTKMNALLLKQEFKQQFKNRAYHEARSTIAPLLDAGYSPNGRSPDTYKEWRKSYFNTADVYRIIIVAIITNDTRLFNQAIDERPSNLCVQLLKAAASKDWSTLQGWGNCYRQNGSPLGPCMHFLYTLEAHTPGVQKVLVGDSEKNICL